LDYRELRSTLITKGEAKEDRSGHHVFYMIEINGKLNRATKLSHSAHGQIDKYILGAIARQMRLKTKELRDFVDCSFSRDQWIKAWLTQEH